MKNFNRIKLPEERPTEFWWILQGLGFAVGGDEAEPETFGPMSVPSG